MRKREGIGVRKDGSKDREEANNSNNGMDKVDQVVREQNWNPEKRTN